MVLTGAVNAGTIAAKIRLDSTLDADSRKANKSLASVGTALAGVTVAAGAAALALSATIGKQVILAGSDVEEMMGKFDAVFRDNADNVEAWADSFGDDVGRSKFELMDFASTLQDTFVPLGFARDEGAELSKQLTELAVDLASFNNEAEPETIASLQSAIVGNHETMRKYGVIITQTTLDQKLLSMGIQGGIRAATEQEKVQARLNIIMEGTTDAQGDAARTSGSFANQSRKLKSQLSEMMGEAGRDELPEMTQVLVEFDTWGQAGGYDNIQGFFSDVAAAATLAAKGIADFTEKTTFIYSFYADKYGNLQEDFKTKQSGWAQSMLDSNVALDAQQKELLESRAAYGSVGDSALQLQTSYIDLSKVSKGTADDIVNDANMINTAISGAKIPGFAGHSDYIRSIGGIPEEFNVPNVAPTLFAGGASAGGAGGSSVSMLNTINKSIQEGNTIMKAVVSAVDRVSISSRKSGAGIRGSGVGQASPETIFARMKQNYEQASTSDLRL